MSEVKLLNYAQVRKRAGLSQGELGASVGLSKGPVYRFEKGETESLRGSSLGLLRKAYARLARAQRGRWHGEMSPDEWLDVQLDAWLKESDPLQAVRFGIHGYLLTRIELRSLAVVLIRAAAANGASEDV